ncbi:hypothetical protein [Lampropedia puyangensis]|uniref:hypothetical protein n=1 Tax=Lampropedia puyangensis TaxID=1330072 RepID=UPI001B87CFC0|nr:hypothetical protein [Lampropedia puyangensis]
MPLVLMADLVLAEIAYWTPDSRYGSLLGSAILLTLPGVLAGSLTPYAMRLMVARVEEAGARAVQLSALTTLGAAAGCLTTVVLLGLVVGDQYHFAGIGHSDRCDRQCRFMVVACANAYPALTPIHCTRPHRHAHTTYPSFALAPHARLFAPSANLDPFLCPCFSPC